MTLMRSFQNFENLKAEINRISLQRSQKEIERFVHWKNHKVSYVPYIPTYTSIPYTFVSQHTFQHSACYKFGMTRNVCSIVVVGSSSSVSRKLERQLASISACQSAIRIGLSRTFGSKVFTFPCLKESKKI